MGGGDGGRVDIVTIIEVSKLQGGRKRGGGEDEMEEEWL